MTTAIDGGIVSTGGSSVRLVAEFKAGDVAVLRSGGPNMTVLDQHGGAVDCRWMHDGEVRDATFPAAALVVQSAPPGARRQ